MGRNRGQETVLEANRMSRGMKVVTSGGMIENRLMDTGGGEGRSLCPARSQARLAGGARGAGVCVQARA